MYKQKNNKLNHKPSNIEFYHHLFNTQRVQTVIECGTSVIRDSIIFKQNLHDTELVYSISTIYGGFSRVYLSLTK